ncbi:MAG: DUF2953 domain-containing protein [Clostridia bacterium]|nr:DUF2953 domain-containing protein [Clostridia bacterium]
MTALYIIGGILLFLFVLLLIPVSAEISYIDDFNLRVKYGVIKVFDNAKPKKEKKAKPKKPKGDRAEKGKKESFISRIFKEKGKIGGIKFCFAILKAVFSKLIWVLKKISFKKLFLDITVSSDDAANTAVTYGAVCAAVYPVIALIKENTKIGVSEVNVSTDFEKISPVVKAAVAVKTRLLYAVIAAVALLAEYLRISKESERNERK